MCSHSRTILIVGGDSRLGREIATAHRTAGDRVVRTTRRTHLPPGEIFLNLSAAEPALPPGRFDIAYFCAGITNLAYCEAHRAETEAVNVHATTSLIRRLCRQGTFVVFLSTNLVFDGRVSHMPITALRHPRCVYGQHKAAVETAIEREGLPAAVVRMTKVLAPDNALFDGWRRNLDAGGMIEPFSDRVMAPVTLQFAVEAVVRVGQRGMAQTVHVSAERDISYAEAAHHFARLLGHPSDRVRPKRDGDAACAGPHRPRFTSLAVGPGSRPAPCPFQAIEELACATGHQLITRSA